MSKVDVFLRCAPQTWLRAGMAISCIEAWKLIPEANLRIIVAGGSVGAIEMQERHPFEMVLPFENFHWTTRIYADEHTTTEPYVVADDDRIPMSTKWLKTALYNWEFYNAYKQYPMLVDVSALAVERYVDADPYFKTSEPVQESPYFAGPNYVSYKGAIDYRQFNGPAHSQDGEVEAFCKSKGIKQAVMKDVVSNHCGVGWSQAQPKLWGRF